MRTVTPKTSLIRGPVGIDPGAAHTICY
jgi:hypothetical protein